MLCDDDRRLEACAREVGEFLLASAFRKYTFVYGTMGKGSAVVKAAKTLFSRRRKADSEQRFVDRELNLVDPGVRATPSSGCCRARESRSESTHTARACGACSLCHHDCRRNGG